MFVVDLTSLKDCKSKHESSFSVKFQDLLIMQCLSNEVLDGCYVLSTLNANLNSI